MARALEKTILVVDDEPDVRNFLATYLEDAGFNIETAIDGTEALEKVKANIPDLITLDMVMPRKSGIQVMRTLRDNKEWATIPVIVITAHARDELGSEDIKEFSAFTTRHRPKFIMEKPITPAKLLKTIGEILDVEIEVKEEKPGSQIDQRQNIKSLIDNTDPETIKKISELLKNK